MNKYTSSLKKQMKSTQGSVMLEFCLVLPIYLLLFGGTFLSFDISMGRLHLQEANRNLAWIQNDRYDSEGKINQTLYQRSVDFFELRNALEDTMTDEPMWSFGDDYSKYAEKKSKNNSCTNPDFWGRGIGEFKDRNAELKINNGWASSIGLDHLLPFDNDFVSMYSGNMELKMEKVSAVYMGAVGLSSVLFPNTNSMGEETNPLYQASYVFTRALDKEEDGSKTKASDRSGKPSIINCEAILLRRSGNEDREQVRTLNLWFDNSLFKQNILFRSWPSNGTLGDLQIFLGVKL